VTDQLDDFSRIMVGTASREARDLFTELLQAGQYKIDQGAFAELRLGSLTAERALVLFAEKAALYRILNRLHQRDATGQNAARRVAQRELNPT
jgi:hypothetical protein